MAISTTERKKRTVLWLSQTLQDSRQERSEIGSTSVTTNTLLAENGEPLLAEDGTSLNMEI